ncbi:MAG: glycosyltransferase family 9 protein [Myxococcota bacterium]
MVSGGPNGALWRMRKQLTASVISAILPAPRPVELQLGRPLRVGYLRIDRRVGEVLLQTPIFHAHKRARPDDTVSAIVHPRMARVLRGQPHIDEVVPFSWRGFPAVGESRDQLAVLRALKLDVAVDCGDPSLFSVGHALATRATGAPVRIGFARGPAADHYTHPVTVPEPLHEATARARLLGPLGIDAGPTMHWVPHPREPVILDGEDVLQRMRAEPGRHAVVTPGGRLAWRRAGPAQFGPLCQGLLERGRTPWIAPGPGEDELCADVARAAPGARVLPLTDLDQLGALMQAAGATVCNNSGPMHLSAACGAPTFALFAKMDPTRWGHFQPEHEMVVVDLESPDEGPRLKERVLAWLDRLGGAR